MWEAVAVVGSYLIGAIPFGYLIGLVHGRDIRNEGSRNIGATNAGRVLGRRWGYACLILDVLKGLLPTILAGQYFVSGRPSDRELLTWLAVGVSAVLGHVFPVYLGFRGGKGVATTVGVALGIWPYFTVAMAAALLGYATVRFSTGWVSAGSLALAVVFPLAFYAYAVAQSFPLGELWPLQAVALSLSALIILRHRSNIARLLRGEESRVR